MPLKCCTACKKRATRRIWSAAASATCCSAAGPKDFDIGTSAHPYQVKKLFRNCWIIGRRFRLAHVRFGLKAIEVATFRKNIPAGSEAEPSEAPPSPHGDRRGRPR